MAESTKTTAQRLETVTQAALNGVVLAAKSQAAVCGLTHKFYRYPARFSPEFARAVIQAFTKPGDTVFDPFMGGGTALVEAAVLGRKAVGIDLNPLAVFVSRAKTTPLTESDIVEIRRWSAILSAALNLGNPALLANDWARFGYLRNLSGRTTWPIRKALELGLMQVKRLPTRPQRHFARCLLLKTAQWALDCRSTVPSVNDFRQRLFQHLEDMLAGASEYKGALAHIRKLHGAPTAKPYCFARSVIGVEKDKRLAPIFPPALILTSPPYPGVHVLYHRWQVQGRRETPAPFWIAGSVDGNGASYYTFGDRKGPGLTSYYRNLRAAVRSLSMIADRHTMLVQLVAFSDASWQLRSYLEIMEEVGFREIEFRSICSSKDGRIWRRVPNRKWYASQKKGIMSSMEVVLFHRLA